MKRLSATLILALLVGTISVGSALAQQRRMNPEQMKERMTAQIDETVAGLALTGDRAETVKLLLTSQGEKRIALQAAARPDGGQTANEDRRAAMMKMRELVSVLDQETLKLLGEVLSEEELVKYSEIVEAQRPRRRRGNPNTQ